MFKLKLDSKSRLLAAIAMVSLIGTSACTNGSSSIANVVTAVSLKSYAQGSDDWVQMSATLATGGFMLAGINLPIANPSSPGTQYGQFSLIPNLCSGSGCVNGGQLSVAVNITQISKAPSGPASLPNSTALPVGGLQSATIVSVPVNDSGATIYFAFGPGVALLGTSVSFSVLDTVGQYVPGADIFQQIAAGPINLIAGLYIGAAAKTTGIALFVDLSTVVNQSPTLAALAPAQKSLARMRNGRVGSSSSGSYVSSVVFKEAFPSTSDAYKVYKELTYLQQKGAVLKVE